MKLKHTRIGRRQDHPPKNSKEKSPTQYYRHKNTTGQYRSKRIKLNVKRELNSIRDGGICQKNGAWKRQVV